MKRGRKKRPRAERACKSEQKKMRGSKKNAKHATARQGGMHTKDRNAARQQSCRRDANQARANKTNTGTSPNAPHRGRNRRTSPNNRLAGHYIIMVARHERKFGSDEQRRAQQSITSEQSKQAEPRLAEKCEVRGAEYGKYDVAPFWTHRAKLGQISRHH